MIIPAVESLVKHDQFIPECQYFGVGKSRFLLQAEIPNPGKVQVVYCIFFLFADMDPDLIQIFVKNGPEYRDSYLCGWLLLGCARIFQPHKRGYKKRSRLYGRDD